MSGHRHKHGNTQHGGHATDEFMSSHPCPSTGKPSRSCPGYVISDGGTGDPSTMQWQAVQAPM
jgi:hypothetical protein